MSDTEEARPEKKSPLPVASLTALASLLILLLAVAALLVPRSLPRRGGGVFLVIDPMGAARGRDAYTALVRWVAQKSGYALRLEVVSTLGEFATRDWSEVDLVLGPDGVALALPVDSFVSLAAGRRLPPYNRRPRAALVYRHGEDPPREPWYSAPDRTIFGDSLSLCGYGVLCRQGLPLTGGATGERWRGRWAFGPDPYDHAPALHALRLGCFDYAVVRDLAVQRLRDGGLLSSQQFGVRELSASLPDVVLMVSRRWSVAARVRLGENLLVLGRSKDDDAETGAAVRRGLAALNLDGFSLLLAGDFEQVRREFHRCWPEGGF